MVISLWIGKINGYTDLWIGSYSNFRWFYCFVLALKSLNDQPKFDKQLNNQVVLMRRYFYVCYVNKWKKNIRRKKRKETRISWIDCLCFEDKASRTHYALNWSRGFLVMAGRRINGSSTQFTHAGPNLNSPYSIQSTQWHDRQYTIWVALLSPPPYAPDWPCSGNAVCNNFIFFFGLCILSLWFSNQNQSDCGYVDAER